MAIRTYAIKSPSRSIMSLFRTFCRLAAVAAAAGAALVATPQPAQAWTCLCVLDYDSISEYANSYDVVFTGQFVRIIQSEADYVTLLFRVERVYKGEASALLAARTSPPPTSFDSCDSSVAPEPGEAVALMAHKQDGHLYVGYCGSWFTVDMFQEVFGPGYPPGSPPPPGFLSSAVAGMPAAAIALLIWAAGFLLICGAAAAYHLRRRQSGVLGKSGAAAVQYYPPARSG